MPKILARYNENDVSIYPQSGRRQNIPKAQSPLSSDGDLRHPVNIDREYITYPRNVIIRSHADEKLEDTWREDENCIRQHASCAPLLYVRYSFIRTRDRRYYLCKQTKAGYIGLRLSATGAGLVARGRATLFSSFPVLPSMCSQRRSIMDGSSTYLATTWT